MKSLLLLGLLALPFLPARAFAPDADKILRQMSDTLAAAPTLRFSATREIDGSLLGLEEKRVCARVDALVQRPNKFAATARGKAGLREFRADGRTLTLFEARPNFYAVIPMPATLDLLVAHLDEKFGFTPPLAEFALSDPYRELRRDAPTVAYLGRARIGGFLGLGGILCERLSLKGPDATAELWIGVEDHLPRRLTATFLNFEIQPTLRVTFHRWELNAPVKPADFTFTPPAGATRIEMWTTEKMKATATR